MALLNRMTSVEPATNPPRHAMAQTALVSCLTPNPAQSISRPGNLNSIRSINLNGIRQVVLKQVQDTAARTWQNKVAIGTQHDRKRKRKAERQLAATMLAHKAIDSTKAQDSDSFFSD